MPTPTVRSWLANLFGDDAPTKPDTRARLDMQSLDARALPTVMGGMSVICGSVYVDSNCNGVRDAGEAGIAGVKISLEGKTATGQTVHRTVHTDSHGNFEFKSLGKGCYTLTESQPAGFKDGADRGPTAATANDQFGKINLNGYSKQAPYTFGELKQEPKCDDGKGTKGKGSGGKGSKGKGSACKVGSKGKGSKGKGSGGKGSSGKCDIWAGYDPKHEKDCDEYKPCGYGYKPCDDGKGSGGKGSSRKGSGGKGSSRKGSGGKGEAADCVAKLYGVGGKW